MSVSIKFTFSKIEIYLWNLLTLFRMFSFYVIKTRACELIIYQYFVFFGIFEISALFQRVGFDKM